MNELQTLISNYLSFCHTQKCLDEKTLKAYRIDLRQLADYLPTSAPSQITPAELEKYIAKLHQQYKPKTAKRKIASAKAFFHYLEYKEIIDRNPFSKIQIRFREPVLLPKTIPLYTVEAFLSAIYKQRLNGQTAYQKRNALRDAAAIELLFATGMRISELCSLKECDVFQPPQFSFTAREGKNDGFRSGVMKWFTFWQIIKKTSAKKSSHASTFLPASPARRSPIRQSGG